MSVAVKYQVKFKYLIVHLLPLHFFLALLHFLSNLQLPKVIIKWVSVLLFDVMCRHLSIRTQGILNDLFCYC